MLTFISENIATIIILLILISAVVAITANLIKNRKKGKSSCGCGCENCPMSGSCHSEK